MSISASIGYSFLISERGAVRLVYKKEPRERLLLFDDLNCFLGFTPHSSLEFSQTAYSAVSKFGLM
ncbi:MAG: hypothetical protein A2900_01070 [Candidatus Chisholmbacteria bacterium RIFCSPLOWO2_01_FULL_50_28]|uniref:Uncharacterized protein n=1 Tax=Candidatus Chisholmbacteria bacterium RIFCSPHIGHO2_01_FULL_52_32 TaxID=1797591 RepID=A0A1G1VUJ9_9BACT|nr:MAG: hypothetical protein A2786_06130 [Candidatus Chisholmbacteria bacterium RIFCSPHIGHO2_01_FULL_52_32]OGY19681.1 MAG: hypothetical protein A2900_01070 [Candidatus Chisholmbacteria bacterium RIFCSPLOWO2_01_FULL_50_28]